MSKFLLHYHKLPKINTSFIDDPSYNILDNNIQYNSFSLDKIQFYNPLYSELFHLDKTNYNKISLNHKYHFTDNNHVYDIETKQTLETKMFFKFSPLIDPLRYLVGKYDKKVSISTLPTITDTSQNVIPKMAECNNVSYTDNFFYYLTSQLLNTHKFINSTDYYGSMLCIQDKFKLEISDDIEYLYNSKFFNENASSLCSISENTNEFVNFASRANKERLRFSSKSTHNISSDTLPDILETSTNTEDCIIIDVSGELVYENTSITDKMKINDDTDCSSSENSSENSSIENSDNDDTASIQSGDEWETDESDSSCCSDIDTFAYINNFPVQAICIEKCQGTFDALFETESLSSHEGICALFQVIMILLCYQKSFHFTHNDLHTNNIMYITTDEPFLYYYYNKQTYRVPTYGRIFKIIDFGRAIYNFNGRRYCSDSFAPDGDANTQYNCEPYLNPDKPRINPNDSFDLCRLGCSIYDFIIDDDEDESDFNDLQKIVSIWCKDDYGKNILYKKNGEERYPNFKLYKMIARTVHQHTPEIQLDIPVFKAFEINKSDMDKVVYCIDIDAIPAYV
jgi:hypothetical protein